MKNYIAVALLIFLNFLLLANSLDVGIFSTIKGFKQTTCREGDNIELTCDFSKINDTDDGDLVSVDFIQKSKFFTITADGSVKTNINVTGWSHSDKVSIDPKAKAIITLFSADEKLDASPFKCEITTNKTGTQIKYITQEVKYWGANITGNLGVKIYEADPNKPIKEFYKDAMVTVGCNDVKLQATKDGTISQIKLLQNGKPLVEFQLSDVSKNLWTDTTHDVDNGIKKTEYEAKANMTEIHIHSAKEDAKGDYTCVYQFNTTLGATFTYTVGSDKVSLSYKSSGLSLNSSFILILISVITVLFSISK